MWGSGLRDCLVPDAKLPPSGHCTFSTHQRTNQAWQFISASQTPSSPWGSLSSTSWYPVRWKERWFRWYHIQVGWSRQGQGRKRGQARGLTWPLGLGCDPGPHKGSWKGDFPFRSFCNEESLRVAVDFLGPVFPFCPHALFPQTQESRTPLPSPLTLWLPPWPGAWR